jgi:cytoskeletal protein CcmA (bactofilin family)
MNYPRACVHALLALPLALVLAGSAAAHDGDDISSVQESINVSAGEHRGAVHTVNGSIHIGEGASVNDAHTVNGSITLGPRATATEAKTVNGSVHLEDGSKVSGGLATVNGSLSLAPGADVAEGLTTVNGGIHINSAHVGGDISSRNGGMEIGPNAHVDGGILVRKSHSDDEDESRNPPHIVIGPGSVVKGSLRFERTVKLYVSDHATIGAVEGATPISFSGDHPHMD